MKALDDYRHHLESIVATAQHQDSREWLRWVPAILDGQASRILNLAIPREVLHESGIFLTGSKLAKKLAREALQPGRTHLQVMDPACGMGDLLIAAATHLPVFPSLKKTFNYWNEALWGLDLHPNFIAITKLRLSLLLMSRRNYSGQKAPPSDALFPHIRVGDFFSSSAPKSLTHFLLNPPFTYELATTSWGSGKISVAARFVSRCIDLAEDGTVIAAIVPDALRSGSRYRAWRKETQELCTNHRLQPAGAFGNADVDVSIFHAEKVRRDIAPPKRTNRKPSAITVANHFRVNVGAVVPHRDKKIGPTYSFLDVPAATPWKQVTDLTYSRRFRGTVKLPPFVAIRRTSAPTDSQRAIGAIIRGNSPIAVENHLLIASPYDGKISTCRKLLRSLKDARTTKWLNRRIRCRHLTVDAVSGIPLWGWS